MFRLPLRPTGRDLGIRAAEGHRRPHRPLARAALAAALMAASLATFAGTSTAETPPLGADLHGLLAAAHGSSPEFASMQREADAARARIAPAGSLPDPVLRVELENLDNPDARRETKLTLMQPLPGWGKRGLRQEAAAAEARQAEARTAVAWNDIASRIKAAHAQRYAASGMQRLAREVLDLVERLERVAQSRYAAGLAPQQDAIRAQLEQTALRTELVALDGEQRRLRARLNALLARDADAPLAEPAALPPLPPQASLSLAGLLQRARERNPQLQVEAARVQAAEKNRDLALRNRTPDWTIGVAPTQMGSRIASWAVMVEVNIPLQRSAHRAHDDEAAGMLAAARARAEAADRELGGELAAQLADFEAARGTEALLRTQLLPQSELSLQSALAAYENGKADFATLLEAQRQLRKARQDLLKAEVESRLRLAEIERTVGDTQ